MAVILRFFILGLLAFFLVTTVFPTVAQTADGRVANLGVLPPVSKQLDAQTIENSTSPTTFLERGIVLYQEGRFAEAIALWQQAQQTYQAKGNDLNLARVLVYLSNAYQNLGQLDQAEATLTQSLKGFRNSAPTTGDSTLIFAQALNSQGNLQLAKGQTEAALETWKQAESAYTKAGDEAGILGSQINQVQALQALGLYQRAKTRLETINQRLLGLPDSLIKVTGLRSAAEVLQVLGDFRQSQEILTRSLAIAKTLNSPQETSAILFSLGNQARGSGEAKAALDFYQQAAAIASSPISQLEALLNQLSLSIETQQWESANALFSPIQAVLVNLAPSRRSVYAQVNFAESLMKLGNHQQFNNLFPIATIAQRLAKAIEQARSLQDPRAESYALGTLGYLYEQNQQLSEAEQLTQQALTIAQSISANDIIARYGWQLGRILHQRRDRAEAVRAYQQAVNALQILRSDLTAINSDIQFSFRESVEPVYRELVALLLQPASNQGKQEPNQSNLKQARELIEALQLAELDNFFRESCLDVKPQEIESIDSQAAVIYPIILKESLEVIVSLPGKPLRYSKTNLDQNQVEQITSGLLQSLNPAISAQRRLQLAQQVYDWLIRPVETDLAVNEIKTLVFVLDGSLRNLPMAVLHDGQQYLIEKYSIALSPGLRLLPARNTDDRLARNAYSTMARSQSLEALTAGLTEPRSGFLALPGVELELDKITSEIPAKVLLNQEFTEKNLSARIQATAFPIVHLATHGQFSSNQDETFILTWNEKLNVRQFEKLLRSRENSRSNPIELLVLSACQTAAGDNRATLGLAGVAIRSGARSTLATLWSVRDLSTATLIAEFYKQLNQPNVTKAEALRRAQVSLLKTSQYQHPFYWSPFVLVGNWL